MTKTMDVDADRWLEIDLYWFTQNDIEGSARAFWERFEPLLRGVTGWRGVIINAGWLADQVLSWQGDLNQPIPFPQGLGKDKFFPDQVPLTGSLEERHAGWHARFDDRGVRDPTGYQPWTYLQLQQLAQAIRQEAKDTHRIDEVKVGIFVIGWDSIYACEPSAWSRRHPEAFFEGPWVDRLFNVVATLTQDPVPAAAFPDGIPEGTPITRFFGQQWGNLSAAVGLDVIVLRDSMIGQGIYERLGPYGATAPTSPELVAQWSAATAALVRETKLAAPSCLVIGYSNAASAVADWRVNCVDLESIGHEGFLDAWIDQTWAGAWNEVGQREDLFWNLPLQGWTNQLGFVLLRAAALADTPVRHYVLTETFDAWESWDIIHTAAQRLRWGIWAYLHAFVKTPAGLKAPRGSYVSWLNQGTRLLTKSDVGFLARNINQATTDARQTTEVFGPTVVYSRPAMQWQSEQAPAADIKEWIDEQAGFLLKFGVPISSATRSEYLDVIDSDYLMIQTPHHLPEPQITSILHRIESGLPTMVLGDPADGIDGRIAAAVGLQGSSGPTDNLRSTAASGASAAADIPATFPIVHRWSPTVVDAGVDVLYSVDGSPALVRRGAVAAWDPADVIHRKITYSGLWDFGRHNGDRPVVDLMGSPYPFLLTAREILRVLRTRGALATRDLGAQYPVTVTAWRSAGEVHVLVADLEEGFRDTTAGGWTVTIDLPIQDQQIDVPLRYAESKLFRTSEKGSNQIW